MQQKGRRRVQAERAWPHEILAFAWVLPMPIEVKRASTALQMNCEIGKGTNASVAHYLREEVVWASTPAMRGWRGEAQPGAYRLFFRRVSKDCCSEARTGARQLGEVQPPTCRPPGGR